jgi:hypothetical protein
MTYYKFRIFVAAIFCVLPTIASAGPPCSDSPQCWSDLISFRPSLAIQAALAQRVTDGHGWYPHRIDKGIGPVNLDFYAVEIKKLPTVNGHKVTASELLALLRDKFADFLPSESIDAFQPVVDQIDGPLWTSNNPQGAVMEFDLNYLKIPDFDRAAVVTSDYTPQYWRFTTVYTNPTWGHPVSGTREFGFYQGDSGAWMFYTRGSDRATTHLVDYIGGEVLAPILQKALETLHAPDMAAAAPSLFDGGDKVWRGFQKAIAQFVQQHDGIANALVPVALRPAWEDATVVRAYQPTTPWQTDYLFAPVQVPSATATSCTAVTPDGTILGTYTLNGKSKAFALRDKNGDGLFSADEFVELGGQGGEPHPVTAEGDAIAGYMQHYGAAQVSRPT